MGVHGRVPAETLATQELRDQMFTLRLNFAKLPWQDTDVVVCLVSSTAPWCKMQNMIYPTRKRV